MNENVVRILRGLGILALVVLVTAVYFSPTIAIGVIYGENSEQLRAVLGVEFFTPFIILIAWLIGEQE